MAAAVEDFPVEQEATEESPTDLFGMDEAAFLASLRDADGVVPDEMLEKLKIRRLRDGMEEVVSLAEHRDDVLRHSDYSRKLNELRGERVSFKKTQEHFGNLVDGWKKNPGRMGDDLELLGIDLEAVLTPIAMLYAQEADMTPRERELSRRAREAERRERMSMLRRKAETQRVQGDKQAATRARLEEHIAGFRTKAFQAMKLTDSKTARRIFEDHLRGYWQTGALTPQIAAEAAKATHADLVALAREHMGAAPAPQRAQEPAPRAAAPAARPLPPRGAAPGGGQAAATMKGGSVHDFHAHTERLRESRRGS
jgi:hypothetical protein